MILKGLLSSIQLGKDTNIHVVFLDLMFALAPSESTCCAYCSISKTLGMQEGQTSSWHPLKVYTCTEISMYLSVLDYVHAL